MIYLVKIKIVKIMTRCYLEEVERFSGLAQFAKRWLVRSGKLRQARVMLSFFSLFFVRWVYFILFVFQ
jgi:hypothetical protein